MGTRMEHTPRHPSTATTHSVGGCGGWFPPRVQNAGCTRDGLRSNCIQYRNCTVPELICKRTEFDCCPNKQWNHTGVGFNRTKQLVRDLLLIADEGLGEHVSHQSDPSKEQWRQGCGGWKHRHRQAGCGTSVEDTRSGLTSYRWRAAALRSGCNT